MARPAPLLVAAVAAVSCRGPANVAAPPQDCPAPSASAAPDGAVPAASGAEEPTAATSGPTEPEPGTSATPPPGEPVETLPEVRVANVGLHIGGGPNDAATKAPFQAAIARHFDEFRRCYALVENPGKGGVFGVDLRIPREGGPAKVQGSRTAMSGAPFRECVLGVFSKVEFARPPRGPTVISYSIEFTVGAG
jgi:hypothetical protein